MPAAVRPKTPRLPLRIVALALIGAALLLLVTAPGAFADVLTPESGGGSRNAEANDTLYKIALFLGFLIFVLVEGVLVYILVKHRWRRGGPEPAQIRGNTRLEVGWTVGAAVLLVVLSVVTFFFLGDIKNPAPPSAGALTASNTQYATIDQNHPPGDPRKALTVKVNGQQYLWRYVYPNGSYAFYDMVVPYDTTVILDITASDVIHSWWIPKLGGKADATPPDSKYINHTWFKITKRGNERYKNYTGAAIFKGSCAELCGDNHADMRMRVIALPVDQYTRWVDEQKRLIGESQQALAAQRKAANTRE